MIGKPDAERGQIVKAFVKLRAGISPSEPLKAELCSLVRTRLAAYKVPREVAFVADFAMTTSGKINRRALREAEPGAAG